VIRLVHYCRHIRLLTDTSRSVSQGACAMCATSTNVYFCSQNKNSMSLLKESGTVATQRALLGRILQIFQEKLILPLYNLYFARISIKNLSIYSETVHRLKQGCASCGTQAACDLPVGYMEPTFHSWKCILTFSSFLSQAANLVEKENFTKNAY
jgi:hypothetical protein